MKKHNVEQQTPEWHHVRKGKITGTKAKAIMGTPRARKDAIYEIVSERLTVGVPHMDYENPMERGNRLEPDAIAMFELETSKNVERVGFLLHEDNPFIANSPDGIIGETEAVEVKCFGGKNHVKLWLTDEVPSEYLWQVVQYFIVNEKLKTLYFVGYNPDVAVHPLHIIEVKRKDVQDKIDEAKLEQRLFLKEVEDILETIIKL